MSIKIKFGQMRLMLIDSLGDLRDKSYQMENWPDEKYPHPFWDSLRFCVAVIFDDLSLDEDPEVQIGYSLYNQAEVDAIKPVVKVLARILQEIGRNQPDSAYTN